MSFISVTEIFCPDLPSPAPLGSISPDQSMWRVNEKAIYNCKTGYQIYGNNYLICLITGEWSRDPLVCEGGVVLTCIICVVLLNFTTLCNFFRHRRK